MVLSDRDIKEEIRRGHIVIKPLDERDIQPASVDVHLSQKILVFRPWRHPHFIDLRQPLDGLTQPVELEKNQPFSLQPGHFVLGSIEEYIEIPDDLMARLEGKSSLGRIGLLVHSTAGYVDPGFRGHLTLELYNVCALPILLIPGMKVSQISFHRLTSPAERPYGTKGLGSKYQGQTGPVPTRYYQEFQQPSLLTLPFIATKTKGKPPISNPSGLRQWLKNSEFQGSVSRFARQLDAPLKTAEDWVYRGARPGPRYRKKLFQATGLPEFKPDSPEKELLP